MHIRKKAVDAPKVRKPPPQSDYLRDQRSPTPRKSPTVMTLKASQFRTCLRFGPRLFLKRPVVNQLTGRATRLLFFAVLKWCTLTKKSDIFDTDPGNAVCGKAVLRRNCISFNVFVTLETASVVCQNYFLDHLGQEIICQMAGQDHQGMT